MHVNEEGVNRRCSCIVVFVCWTNYLLYMDSLTPISLATHLLILRCLKQNIEKLNYKIVKEVRKGLYSFVDLHKTIPLVRLSH
jgi:hypothetical protein